MKRHLIRTIVSISAAWLTTTALLHAGAEAKQPHMESALHFLQDAKKSDTPVQLLNSAKSELAKSAHNKAGFRENAMDIVEKATAEAQVGDKQKMIEKIDAAIAVIHSGMAHAPGAR